jgi:hypothetical protein
MAPLKFITKPPKAADVDEDFGNMNLDVGTAVLLMVASTNGQVKRICDRMGRACFFVF